MDKIGLIAGNRNFPIIFAQKAKQAGNYIVAVAIKGDTSRRLKNYADKIYWMRVEEFKKMFAVFKQEEVTKIVMAGQVNPRHLFNRRVMDNPDVKALLENLKDKKADTVFGVIAGKLEESGFELLDSTTLVKDLLPKKSVLTRRQPDFREWQDVYFGLAIAKGISLLDIGQAVGVKNKAVVAVEALEGTDALIRRAGRIASKGAVIVKVSKPKQDMRFDIPVVGLNTVKNLIRAGVSLLAIEAEKTLFIDQEAALRLADRNGISIVAV
jgi:hypothetical protein